MTERREERERERDAGAIAPRRSELVQTRDVTY